MYINYLRSILAALMLIFLVPISWAQNLIVATPYNNQNYHTQLVKEFLSALERDTPIKTTLYNNNSLIKHQDLLRAVGGNQVQMGEVVISAFSNDDPIFSVDSIPFLTSSTEDVKRLWKASRTAINQALDRHGLIAVIAISWPPQGMYVNNPLTTPDQLRGVKFRSLSPMSTQLGENLGMRPVQIEAPDIPQAFSTGMINGMFTSAVTGVDSHVWEYVKHFYDIRAWQPLGLVIMNKQTFNSLPEQTKAKLEELAEQIEAKGWDLVDSVTKENITVLLDHDVSVSTPNQGLIDEFKRAAEPVQKKWLDQVGAVGNQVITQYQSLGR